MMRLLVILLLLLFQNCSTESQPTRVDSIETKPESAIFQIDDWIKGHPTDSSVTHHLVFAIDPNDCVSCIITFGELFRRIVVQANPQNCIHVFFPKTRAIERAEAIRTVFGKLDTAGIDIVWDEQLFRQAVAKVKTGEGYSSLLIYTAKGELRFARYGRTLVGTEPELQPFLH